MEWWVGDTVNFSVLIYCFTSLRFQRSLNEVPLKRQDVFSHWAECHLLLIFNLISTDIFFICEISEASQTPKRSNSSAPPPLRSVVDGLRFLDFLLESRTITLTWNVYRILRSWGQKNVYRVLRETLCRREWRMGKQDMYMKKVNHSSFLLVAHTLSFSLSVMTQCGMHAFV